MGYCAFMKLLGWPNCHRSKFGFRKNGVIDKALNFLKINYKIQRLIYPKTPIFRNVWCIIE